MPHLDVELACPIHDSFRVRQIAGMFDLPIEQTCTERFSAEVPDTCEPWEIGVIVGPSGSGKTTIARRAFGDALYRAADWPDDRAVIDCFGDRPIKQIVRTLTAVGFSSPPSWLKPFAVLSNGEKFRCELARALLRKRDEGTEGQRDEVGNDEETEGRSDKAKRDSALCPFVPLSLSPSLPIIVFDEFTSLVDRTVACISSAALSRAIRRGTVAVRFVAVTCHYDVVRWLEPDWVLDMGDIDASGQARVRRGRVRRPPIRLRIQRTTRGAWHPFRRHHYLSADLHRSAACFIASYENRPAAFAAVLPFPHPTRPGWREHRLVCLPDFQGIGTALGDFVAALYASTGKPYFSTSSHPAMIRHRANSPLWRMHRPPGFARRPGASSGKTTGMPQTCSRGRITASFEYVGPGQFDQRLGMLKHNNSAELASNRECV